MFKAETIEVRKGKVVIFIVTTLLLANIVNWGYIWGMEKDHLTFNERLEKTGVEIIRQKENGENRVYLKFEDKTLARPIVNRIEEWCLKNFNLEI